MHINVALECAFNIRTQPNTQTCITVDGLPPIPDQVSATHSYSIPIGSLGSVEDKKVWVMPVTPLPFEACDW